MQTAILEQPRDLPPGKVWVHCMRCGEKLALYRNQADKFMIRHLVGKCLEVRGIYGP